MAAPQPQICEYREAETLLIYVDRKHVQKSLAANIWYNSWGGLLLWYI